MATFEDLKPETKAIINPLRKRRGTVKRKITPLVKKLNEMDDDSTLITSVCKSGLSEINHELKNFKKFHEEINSYCEP